MESIRELIELAQNGDQDSFGKLYERHKAKGINIAKQYVKAVEDAEDVYQDAFMKAMEHIDSFDATREFAPWLDTIIVNTAKNALAKKRPQNFSALSDEESEYADTLVNADEEVVPESAYDRKELMDIMDGIVGELPQAQREAVVLYYYKEMSVKQIAEFQQVPEDTVKSRLNYSRKKVAAGVEAYEKKTGIKLRSTAIPTILLWLYFKNSITAKACESAIGGTAAAASASAGTASVAKGTASSMSVLIKVLAGILAGIVCVVAIIAAVKNSNPKQQEENTYEEYSGVTSSTEQENPGNDELLGEENHENGKANRIGDVFVDGYIQDIQEYDEDNVLVTWSDLHTALSANNYEHNLDRELSHYKWCLKPGGRYEAKKYPVNDGEGNPDYAYDIEILDASTVLNKNMLVQWVDSSGEAHETTVEEIRINGIDSYDFPSVPDNRFHLLVSSDLNTGIVTSLSILNMNYFE